MMQFYADNGISFYRHVCKIITGTLDIDLSISIDLNCNIFIAFST